MSSKSNKYKVRSKPELGRCSKLRGGVASNMVETDCRIIDQLGLSIDVIAGKEIRDAVMEGSEELSKSSDPEAFAEWVKDAIARLDSLVDENTSKRIMWRCGTNCYHEYKEVLVDAKERLGRSKNLDSFLRSEQNLSLKGMKLSKKGNVLHLKYDPRSFVKPMRCYCHLLKELPEDEVISPTYCRCSEGFLRSFWSDLLDRPVKVRMLESVISGGKTCRFEIDLNGP